MPVRSDVRTAPGQSRWTRRPMAAARSGGSLIGRVGFGGARDARSASGSIATGCRQY